MTFIARPLEITPRNSATITASSDKVKGMLASLIHDAANAAKVYATAADSGSQERYDFAEAAFELDAVAARLGWKQDRTPEEAASEAAAREAGQ